jgi:predicted enzyme related to lactoylglutathione lyase
MTETSSHRVVVLSLWAEDVSKTAHFYKDVLGLELFSHHHGDRPHFKVGDGYLTILQGKPYPAEEAEPFPLFALEAANLDAALEKLHAHGVKTPDGIQDGSRSRYVIFDDPAGNLIELVQFIN